MIEHQCSRCIDPNTLGRVLFRLTRGVGNANWLIVHEFDLAVVLRSAIISRMWMFGAPYMAKKTGVGESVFLALHALGQEANSAINAIVSATCTLQPFYNDYRNENRGKILSTYDDEERVINCNGTAYYCYRLE